MSIRKRWYIQVMRADSARSLTLSFDKSTLQIILAIVLICTIVLAIGVLRVWSKNSDLSDLSKIKTENELLRERMSYFSIQMDSLLIKIKIMENWEDELRRERNLKIIDPDIRAMGTGGQPSYDPTFLLLDTDLDNLFNDNLRKLTYVQSKTALVYQTHNELIDTIQTREIRYRSTPSIWPTFGEVTSRYGGRVHPVFRRSSFHSGIDIANDRGTPIYATADGTVSTAGYSGQSGNLIRIDHAAGYQTRYAHLDRILVRQGQFVEKGQLIARMGRTGVTTGNHLHYEVLDTKTFKLLNPALFFNISEDQIDISRI